VDIGQLYSSCKWVQHLKRLSERSSCEWVSGGTRGSSGHWAAVQYSSCKWVQHLKRLGKKEAAVDGSAAKEGDAVDIGQLYSRCKCIADVNAEDIGQKRQL
jgi:hypothetical protein